MERIASVLIFLLLTLGFTACGGGSSGSPISSNPSSGSDTSSGVGINLTREEAVQDFDNGNVSTVSIGGTIVGQPGNLVLALNGDNQSFSGSSFIFQTELALGDSYSVVFVSALDGHDCVVGNSSGTANADIDDVIVTCAPPPPVTHTIGGQISGNAGDVVLSLNGENQTFSGGDFTFADALDESSTYTVAFVSGSEGEDCAVSNSTGNATSDVTNVSVSCELVLEDDAAEPVSGLAGTYWLRSLETDGHLQMQSPALNSPLRTVNADTHTGTWTQWQFIPNGDYYFIRNVANDFNIRPIDASDSSVIHTVPESFTGNWTQWRVEATEVEGVYELTNRETGRPISPENANIESPVTLQPVGSTATSTAWRFNCVPIENNNENCPPLPESFSVGGTISGNAGDVVLSLNGANETFSSGDFVFTDEVEEGAEYMVTFVSADSNYNCEISNNSGIVSNNVANIGVSCSLPVAPIMPQNPTPEPSDRFVAIEDHINGVSGLTIEELQAWHDEFVSEQPALLFQRPEDYVAAIELVRLYEEERGPLFTSQGRLNFTASWDNENNFGSALARVLHRVYLSIFDGVRPELIQEYPQIVEGLMFRSTEFFPGSVPSPEDPNTLYEVRINGTLEPEFGYEGGYNLNAARRMTGAYLTPGEIAEVIVPQSLVNAGYSIRVGGHSWDLSNRPNVRRMWRISNTFEITDTVTQVANPMGGNIYIEVPIGASAGLVDVQFRNTIRAPFFSGRGFDETTEQEWENVERSHPGSFTDIEGEGAMFTIPSKWVRQMSFDELAEILEAHDQNILVASRFVGKQIPRAKANLYMILDIQIRANAFSIGYPQSNYNGFESDIPREPLTLDHAVDPLLWHEHGHAELVSMFAGEPEAWVHALVVAMLVENYGMTHDQAIGRSMAYGSQNFNFNINNVLNSWLLNDQFRKATNGGMQRRQEAAFQPRGHGDYVDYMRLFGLEAMEKFNAQINSELDGATRTGPEWVAWGNTEFGNGARTSHNPSDRIFRLSQAAGVDVTPLFHLWGHPPTNVAVLRAAHEEAGLLPSGRIYDRLIQARDNVPRTQADWDALRPRIQAHVNQNQNVPAFSSWNNGNFNTNHATLVVARVQELIDLYFPDGRPDTE